MIRPDAWLIVLNNLDLSGLGGMMVEQLASLTLLRTARDHLSAALSMAEQAGSTLVIALIADAQAALDKQTGDGSSYVASSEE